MYTFTRFTKHPTPMCTALLYQSVYFAEGVAQQIKFSQKGDASVASVSATPIYHTIQSVKLVQLALLSCTFFAFYWWVTYRHTFLAMLIPTGLEYQTCMFLLVMLTNWIIMKHPQEFHCLSLDNCRWHSSIDSSKRCYNGFKSLTLPPSHLKYKWSAEL